MKKLSFFAVAYIVLTACTPKTAEVIEMAEPVVFPSTDVAEGSKLYAENCGKCHKLKTVNKFSTEEWKTIVPRMAKKAKIDAMAENKVMQYVLWKTEQK
jgi:nitrate/TMAO reductase-like tetraheme cytochrome c subunit